MAQGLAKSPSSVTVNGVLCASTEGAAPPLTASAIDRARALERPNMSHPPIEGPFARRIALRADRGCGISAGGLAVTPFLQRVPARGTAVDRGGHSGGGV